MSRSFKKEAIIKDKGFKKNEYNKRLRRTVKPLVKKAGIVENDLDHVGYEEVLERDGKLIEVNFPQDAKDVVIPNTHEVTNDYDVSDYSSRWNNLELAKMNGREKRRIVGK